MVRLINSPPRWNSVIRGAAGANPLRSTSAVFVDGKDYFKDLAKELRAVAANPSLVTNYYVYILGWMIDVDFALDGSDTLLSLLQAAAKSNVEIRVAVWHNPFYYPTNTAALKKINAISGDVLALNAENSFSTAKTKRALREIKKVVVSVLSVLRKAQIQKLKVKGMPIDKLLKIKSVGSHHDKVVLIRGPNGLIGYCGGIDVNPNRIAKPSSTTPSNQHDIQCRVEDFAAWDLLQRFLRRWEVPAKHSRSRRTMLVGASGGLPPKGTTNQQGHTPYAKAIGTYNFPGTGSSSFTKKDRSARDTILAVIKDAKEYVYIEDQYMTSLEVAKALHQSLRSGLKRVVLVTQRSELATEDIILPNRKRDELIDTLVYGSPKGGLGVKIIGGQHHRLVRNRGMADKVEVYEIAKPPAGEWHQIVHSKLYLIDDEVLVVGSMNVSTRSLAHDSETGIVFVETSPPTGKSFVRDFRIKLWTHHLDVLGTAGPPSGLDPRAQMHDPVAASKDWHTYAANIDRYKPSGDDMDVALRRQLMAVRAKVPWWVPRSGTLKKGIAALGNLVDSSWFRDYVWMLVDPDAP